MPLYKHYRNFKRVTEIVNVFIKHGFGVIIDNIGLFDYLPLKRKNMSEQDSKLPIGVRARKALEELGPTFIKLGQMLSTRKDLLPEEILKELEKLQDDVEPFDDIEVKKIIEKEFGLPVSEVFSDFSKEPIGAASIGQVYKATLKDGQVVIVKVRRPNIEKTVEEDLEILFDISVFLEKRFEWARAYGIVDIVEEFSDTLKREMDFSREGRNADRFRKIFNNSDNVYIPEVYWKYTTSKVLTVEFIDGVKISDIETLKKLNLDTKALAKNLANIYLDQILKFGFFHADPHPGNIVILKDGRIGLLDFGLVGNIKDELKLQGAKLIIAFVQKDIDTICEVLLDMGVTQGKTNISKMKLDIEDLVLEYYDIPLEQIKIGEILTQLLALIRKYQIKAPPEIALLTRTLVLLEGTLSALAPDFNIIELVKPYVKETTRKAFSFKNIKINFENLLKKIKVYGDGIPKHLLNLLQMAENGDLEITLKHDKLELLINRLDIISNRLSFSIIVASIIMGSSLIATRSRDIFMKIPLAELGFLTAGFLGFWLIISIVKSGRI